MTPDTARV
jgi:hypothetical protein